MRGKAQRLITVIVITVRQPNFAFCILNFELKKTEGSFEPSVFLMPSSVRVWTYVGRYWAYILSLA